MSMLNSMLGAVSASDFLPKIGTSTNNAIALWDGTGGSAVKNSSASIDNNNDLSGIRNAVFSGTLSASNLSGTNTGDQDLSGYVPYTGATSNLNLGARSLTASNFSGSSSGVNTGDQTISLTGDVTGSGTGSFAATIAAGAVTYAKIQAASGASKILGSPSTGTAFQEISLGSGLSMSGGTLSATGTGGTVTSFSAGNLSPIFTTSVANATTTPALSFSLSNAAANTYLGNATSGSAAPSYTAAGALTKSDDTNVTLTLSANASTSLLRDVSITAGWTGTLAAARLNSNVVQSITNDTNVTGTISAQNLTLGWGGVLSVGRGGTNASTAAMARVNLGLQIGVDVQAYSAELAAISGMSGLGLAARTAAGTWAARTMQAPAAGLTISNAGGVTGNPTFALADDLSALEALSGTGFATRTGTNTWAQRSFADVNNQTVWTYPDGISGNPYVSLSSTLALPGTLKLGGVVDGQLNNITNLGNITSVATSGSATGATDYSTVTGIGSLGSDRLFGWRFTPTTDIIVTKLQVLDAMFSSGSRDVGLYVTGGSLLASASVAKTDTLNGKFREKAITSIILTAGTSYFIGVIGKSGDSWVVSVSSQTFTNVTFGDGRDNSTPQSTLPSTDNTSDEPTSVTFPCCSILAQPATTTFSVASSSGNTYLLGSLAVGGSSASGLFDVQGSKSASGAVYGALLRTTVTETGSGSGTCGLYVGGTHVINGSGTNIASWLQVAPILTATTTCSNLYGLLIGASTLNSGTLNNAYSAYFINPGVGTNRTALFTEDFSTYTGVTPPANGGIIQGKLGIGISSVNVDSFCEISASTAYGVRFSGTQTALNGTSQGTLWIRSALQPTNGTTGLVAHIFNQAFTIAPSGKTISNAAACFLAQDYEFSAGTITNAYQLLIGTTATVGGTITNNYGAYIGAPNGGTNQTALYADNLSIGFTGITPPAYGGRIAGTLTVGNGANSTSATGPFLYFTTSAGAPTGVPTGYTGLVPLHYDTTNNKLYVYNGAWKSVTLT